MTARHSLTYRAARRHLARKSHALGAWKGGPRYQHPRTLQQVNASLARPDYAIVPRRR